MGVAASGPHAHPAPVSSGRLSVRGRRRGSAATARGSAPSLTPALLDGARSATTPQSGAANSALEDEGSPARRTGRSPELPAQAGSRFTPSGTGFAGAVWASGPFLCREAFGSVRTSGFRASGKPPAPPRFSARGRFAPLFRAEILSPTALRVALHPPVLAATSRLHGKKTRGRGRAHALPDRDADPGCQQGRRRS